MSNPIHPVARKRAINLSINAAVLDQAKALGLNISRVLEDSLVEKARAATAERWRAENREALNWHNALTARMGGTLHELLAENETKSGGDAV